MLFTLLLHLLYAPSDLRLFALEQQIALLELHGVLLQVSNFTFQKRKKDLHLSMHYVTFEITRFFFKEFHVYLELYIRAHGFSVFNFF